MAPYGSRVLSRQWRDAEGISPLLLRRTDKALCLSGGQWYNLAVVFKVGDRGTIEIAMAKKKKNIKIALMLIIIGLFLIVIIWHFLAYREFSELIYNLTILAILIYTSINWFLKEKAVNNVLSDLTEKISDGVMISDLKDVIKTVNSSFEDISGYSKKELLGKKTNILKSGRHDEAFYQNMWDVLKSGKTWRGEIWNKRKDGEIIPQEAIIFQIASVSDNGDDK